MIKEITDKLVKELKKEGFTIQRYDSYTTRSVYLKLDYGVCNSIRISDHRGKKHLAYRYNLIIGRKGPANKHSDSGFDRFFYSDNEIGLLKDKIIRDRLSKINKYGRKSYDTFMKRNQEKNKESKGFWQAAKIV